MTRLLLLLAILAAVAGCEPDVRAGCLQGCSEMSLGRATFDAHRTAERRNYSWTESEIVYDDGGKVVCCCSAAYVPKKSYVKRIWIVSRPNPCVFRQEAEVEVQTSVRK